MKKTLTSLLLFSLLLCPAHAAPDIEEVLAKFEPYAEKSLKEWGTPGMAVAIVVGDKTVYAKGFGVREVGGSDPVTPETLFQIGSISKSFTSALVGQLVDEKKIAWTDPVLETVPGFAMYDPWVTRAFTVEDTMSQRSGMEPYAGDVLAFMGKSREEIVEAIRHIEPVSSARTKFAYVNNLWLVAAQIVEATTGRSWEDNVEARLFGPLGMTASNTGWEEYYDSPNHATPHMRGATGLTPLPKESPLSRWVYIYGPAGGINSNVLDMAKYARMQLGGQIDGKQVLSRAALDHLHAPHIYIGGKAVSPAMDSAECGPVSYCLGWLRQDLQPQPMIWHNGGTSGCRTVLGLVPDSDVAIVVLSNFADASLPEALMFKFYDLYLERPEQDYSANFLKTYLASLPEQPQRPSPVSPPLPLDRYAGVYRNPVYGSLEVRVDGKNLRATLTPTIERRTNVRELSSR